MAAGSRAALILDAVGVRTTRRWPLPPITASGAEPTLPAGSVAVSVRLLGPITIGTATEKAPFASAVADAVALFVALRTLTSEPAWVRPRIAAVERFTVEPAAGAEIRTFGLDVSRM